MKPTWQGWPEIYAAQQTDVTSTSDCLYQGRWTEHDDILWEDWQRTYDILGVSPVQWDHCTQVTEADIDMDMQLWHTAGVTELWHEVHPQTQDTTWIPVEYPN